MKHFSSYYQNAYGHQTLQGGGMLRGALTHKYAWHLNRVVLRGHVTNKNIQNLQIETTLGKVLTWPFDQVTNVRSVWKIYIFHFYNVYS